LGRVPGAPGARESLREPERAADERSFLAFEAVLAGVAREERPVAERAANRFDRRGQPGLAGIVVAHEDGQQQAGIELLPAGEAHIAAQLLRPALPLDELADRSRLGAPVW